MLRVSDPGRLGPLAFVGAGALALLAFAPDLAAAAGGESLLARVPQVVVNGLKLGFIISITSIGLSLVYGTSRLVNFAHGDMVTFGAVVAYFFNGAVAGPGLHLIPAGMAAIVVGVGLGAGLQKGLWQPLQERQTGKIQLFVISIGLAVLLRHLILLQFGGRPKSYIQYAVQEPLTLGWIRITPRDLTVVLISALILVAVGLMLTYSHIGKAMRAVSDNRDLAEASGVDVRKIILMTWMLAGGLGALGGVLFGVVENVNYLMGFRMLLLIFAATILGGLGTAFGAMAGGIVVGLVTEMSTLVSPTELKLMWGLSALVIVQLVRPQGIFGRKERIG